MPIDPKRLLLALLALALTAPGARAQAPTPTIDGPITGPGSAVIQPTTIDLAQVGYVSEEYFISGTASAYANVGPLGRDGL
jgi:hypothetical protein